MLKILNPKKKTYYKSVVDEFSDSNKPIYSGVVKDSSDSRYNWVADFMFKHPGNIKSNRHVAYVSFTGNQNSVISDYKNVDFVKSQFPAVENIDIDRMGDNSRELSFNQYNKIAQTSSEFDSVKLIDPSVYSQSIGYMKDATAYHHRYGYRPAFYSHGVKSKGLISGDNYDIDRLAWSIYDHGSTIDTNTVISRQYSGNYRPPLYGSFNNLLAHFIDDAIYRGDEATYKLMYDHKVKIDGSDFYHFDKTSKWILYLDKDNSLSSEDLNIIETGGIVCYDIDGNEIYPDGVKFYPAIISGGRYESAKVIVDFNEDKTGRCALSSGAVKNYDQSRIVLDITSSMLEMAKIDNNSSIEEYSQIINSNSIIDMYGLDFSAQRWRASSATVTTEPYMTTKAINNSSTMEYMFVDKNGYPKRNSASSNNGLYLKIKGSKAYIDEIDRLTLLSDANNDILTRVTISDTGDISGLTNTAELSFLSFLETNHISINSDRFFERSNFPVLESVASTSNRRCIKYMTTVVNESFSNNEKYRDNKAMIAGISDTYIVRDGNENHYMIMYLNSINDEAMNLPNEYSHGGGTIGQIADAVQSQSSGEIFKPMIKTSGMNGFIKINNRSKHNSKTVVSNGVYEAIYDIEIPFCYGANDLRKSMSSNQRDTYTYGQVLYKDSYISLNTHFGHGAEHPISLNRRAIITGESIFGNSTLCKIVNNEITAYKADGGLDDVDANKYKEVVSYPNISIKVLHPNMYCDIDAYTDTALTMNIVNLDMDSDYKLITMTSNKRWAYDGQFEPYIDGEQPAYIYEIDAKVLTSDISDKQPESNSIPDVKRWVSSLTSGHARMNSINKYINSNLSMDIWDRTIGSWRSTSATDMDYDKVAGSLIVGNLYRPSSRPLTHTFYRGGSISIQTTRLSYLDPAVRWPLDIDHTQYEGLTNKVLYDISGLKAYTILWTEWNDGVVGDNQNPPGLDIYISIPEFGSTLPGYDSVDVNSIPQFEIRESIPLISDANVNVVNSNRAISYGLNGNISKNEIVDKFFDVRTIGEDSDLNRYIDSGKIYFRFRSIPGRKYGVIKTSNKSSDDISTLEISTPTPDSCNPWLDSAMSWDSLLVGESISELSARYFKCYSK